MIQRAAAILKALRAAEAPLSLGRLARETGLARSTVQRIVETLQDADWVTPPSPNGGVLLGTGLTALASVGGRPAQLRILHPFLVKLSAELNETVDLSIRRHDGALFVDQVTADQRLRAVSAVGATFPLYCCANGKAMLSTLPDPLIETLIGRSLPARTPEVHQGSWPAMSRTGTRLRPRSEAATMGRPHEGRPLWRSTRP